MVACGYSQHYGTDYEQTYSPTAKWKSFLILLHISAVLDWDIESSDVENAFVEPILDRDIWMNLPTDLYQHDNSQPVKVKLQKRLYGLNDQIVILLVHLCPLIYSIVM
jgi:hypothetical protein